MSRLIPAESGVAADPVEGDLHHLFIAGRLVGGSGDDLAQLQELALLADLLLSPLALGDIGVG